MKKKITVNFVDFNPEFDKNDNEFMDYLRDRYEVSFSDNPDYLIYSVFGYEHLKYDGIRICYTGENIIPDFNACDYAFGYDRIEFGDRYRRIPIYLLFQYRAAYEALFHRKPVTQEDLDKKKGFCAAVISNPLAMPERDELFFMINDYKEIDSAGKYLNNVGHTAGVRFNPDHKKEFQEGHKFSLAIENQSYIGYSTEKICDSLQAYKIPIYYGDPTVTIEFNDEAFVNVHKYDSFEEAVEVIKEIDQNDELALKMLNANPINKPMNFFEMRDFLYYIMDQDYEHARRRLVSPNAKEWLDMIKRQQFYEDHVKKYVRKVKNELKRRDMKKKGLEKLKK